MAMTICYTVGNKLYLNITNKCPCSCTFCIRKNGDSAYGSDSLWLEHEPNFDEVKNALLKYDLNSFEQIVFCGYGEPTERLDMVIQIGRYIKSVCGTEIRINTNGLSDAINGKKTACMLKDSVDIIYISLNAGDEASYNKITCPQIEDSFNIMKNFALDCKEYFDKVMFTVVDVLTPEEIQNAQNTAVDMGIPLRVRKYDN